MSKQGSHDKLTSAYRLTRMVMPIKIILMEIYKITVLLLRKMMLDASDHSQ